MSQAVKDVKRKKITRDDYAQMKLLLAAGLKPKLVGEVCKRSYGTVNRVMHSSSYEDYRESLYKVNKVYHDKAAKRNGTDEPAESKTPEVAHETAPETTDEPEQVEVTTKVYTAEETLERIATALERLVEAWEAHPQPRKSTFFGK